MKDLTRSGSAKNDLPTPLFRDKLFTLFHIYPNKVDAEFLEKSFLSGFRLPIRGHMPTLDGNVPQPMYSGEKLKALTEIIELELSCNRLLGPFVSPPFERYVISPVHLVPRRQPGKFRLIHNLSYMHGNVSVNSEISDADAHVAYESFDRLVEMVERWGRGCFIFKFDVKSAFKCLPLCPDDYPLMGFKVNGLYYFDKTLAFGLRCSCLYWEKFAHFLQWFFVHRTKYSDIGHYLDEFYGVNGSLQFACSVYECLLKQCDEIGLPLSVEKNVRPTTKVLHLGVFIDTQEGLLLLPNDKLTKLSELVSNALLSEKVSGKEMQVLLGHLNFACRVFVMARPFLRRLYSFLTVYKGRWNHRHRMPAECKNDLRMWEKFLSFNIGVRKIFVGNVRELDLVSDAAASHGFCIVWHKKWIYSAWNGNFVDEVGRNNITFLEFFPIVVAFHVWGEFFAHSKVSLSIDNIAVVHIINSRNTRDLRVSSLLRHFVLMCLKFNILVSAKHLPGARNCVADAGSRGHLTQMQSLAPYLERLPTSFPSELFSL